jgi:hypothetical protein
MNREDIIRIARKAGLHIATDVNWMPIISLEYAERFAALVASVEREACAKVCEEQYEYYGHDHVFAKAIRARGQA